MRYKLTKAEKIQESATGKARLLGLQTSKGMLEMWVPVSQSKFCTDGKWEVEEWWIEQKQDEYNCEIDMEEQCLE